MGSGKSTVGKRLAEKLTFGFIDFDMRLEKESGKTIAEIFDSEGEEKFRLMEHEQLKKLLDEDNVVIALGGGTPCFYNNIERINKNGISIYMEVPVDVLVKRLSKAAHKRPLIRGMNEAELRSFIAENLERRERIYRSAHHIIKIEKQTIEEIADEIISLFREKK